MMLPSLDQTERGALDVMFRLTQDPIAGREALRRLIKDGRFTLDPQRDRLYIAWTELLPLVLLTENKTAPPVTGERYPASVAGARYTGWIPLVGLPCEVRLEA